MSYLTIASNGIYFIRVPTLGELREFTDAELQRFITDVTHAKAQSEARSMTAKDKADAGHISAEDSKEFLFKRTRERLWMRQGIKGAQCILAERGHVAYQTPKEITDDKLRQQLTELVATCERLLALSTEDEVHETSWGLLEYRTLIAREAVGGSPFKVKEVPTNG